MLMSCLKWRLSWAQFITYEGIWWGLYGDVVSENIHDLCIGGTKKIKIKDKIKRLHMLTRQMNVRRLVDSIREAVLTVSPNKQYRGILYPTIPATQEPKVVWETWKTTLWITINIFICHISNLLLFPIIVVVFITLMLTVINKILAIF